MAYSLEVLFTLKPLSRLDDAARSTLAASFAEKVVPARRPLYRSGEALPGLWLMTSGFAKVTRGSPSGRELLMSLVGPGDIVGPCCDPFGSAPTICGATTLTPSRLLYMPSTTWRSLTQTAPALTLALLEALLSNRRGCVNLATDLAFRTVESRLAGFLRSVARWSPPSDRGLELLPPLTHADMANAVGTAREVVTRCLSHFEQRGLVERRGRRVILRDPAALASVEDECSHEGSRV